MGYDEALLALVIIVWMVNIAAVLLLLFCCYLRKKTDPGTPTKKVKNSFTYSSYTPLSTNIPATEVYTESPRSERKLKYADSPTTVDDSSFLDAQESVLRFDETASTIVRPTHYVASSKANIASAKDYISAVRISSPDRMSPKIRQPPPYPGGTVMTRPPSADPPSVRLYGSSGSSSGSSYSTTRADSDIYVSKSALV